MIQHLFFGTIFLIAPNTWMTADHVLNAPWVQHHANYYDVVEEERNELYDLAIFKKESKSTSVLIRPSVCKNLFRTTTFFDSRIQKPLWNVPLS